MNTDLIPEPLQTASDSDDEVDYGSVTGHELSELLAPITPVEFIEEYWQKKPLYVKGTPEKFQTLFNRYRFNRAIRAASRRTDLPNYQLNVIRPVSRED